MAAKRSCRETSKVLKFWILWILGFLPLTMAITSNISDHDLEIMNRLKQLNKPYVKSIKSPDGNIIDCVPLHLQPAFDNPLLKNVTLKMQPSFMPEGYSKNHSSLPKHLIQPWHAVGKCPEGTTPIIRTTKEQLLRLDSIKNYGKKSRPSFRSPNSGLATQTNEIEHEYAIRIVEGGPFYGARASLNVWIPYVQDHTEFSLAQIWVSDGTDDVDLNTIEAGWQVCNQIYGDDSAHIFGFWTSDAYRNGCYNTVCPGFVQISTDVGLGSLISPASEYEQPQVEMVVYIAQDRRSRDWWLKIDNTLVGYWPSTLFNRLQNPATSVNWGGEVYNKNIDGRHTMTEMGSGSFSSEGYTKAAFFAELQVRDASGRLVTPVGLETSVSKPLCYDLTSLTSQRRGECFYYGGPGQSAHCP